MPVIFHIYYIYIHTIFYLLQDGHRRRQLVQVENEGFQKGSSPEFGVKGSKYGPPKTTMNIRRPQIACSLFIYVYMYRDRERARERERLW